jgi:hypothetical protein
MEEMNKFFNVILTEYINQRSLLELDLGKTINDHTLSYKEKIVRVKTIIGEISNVNTDIQTFSSYLPVDNNKNVETI